MPATPPAEIVSWCAGAGVHARRWRWLGHQHAESAVWGALDAEDRLLAVLKQHRSPRKFEQERAAYRRWIGALPQIPHLRAMRDEEPRALLLEALPGRPAAEHPSDTPHRPAWFHAAGAGLSRLHALPHEDRDPLPLATAMQHRATNWCTRAAGLVATTTRYAVLDALHDALAQTEIRRVPCHRDFTDRNWLVVEDAAAPLQVIDFEHARADCALQDLVRLTGAVFPERSDLAAAFYDGYGRRPEAADQDLLDALIACDAVATIVWARKHADVAFEALGRRLLERLGLRS